MRKSVYIHFKQGIDNIWLLKLKRTVSLIVMIMMAPLLLSACGAFRLHDAGRLETSQEALELASELSSGGGAVFEPMENNRKSVNDTLKVLRKKTNDYEYETFKDIVADMSADEIAKRLVEAIEYRIDIYNSIEKMEKNMIAEINDILDEQTEITGYLNETLNDKTDLEKTLKRVEGRLEWIEKIISNVVKLHDKTGTTIKESLTDLTDPITENEKEISSIVDSAKAALKDVEDDELVNDAMKLLRQVSQEVASIEQIRLSEMGLHLKEIRRHKKLLTDQDTVSICRLFVPALGRLYSALSDKEKVDDLVETLKTIERYKCIKNLNIKKLRPDIQDLWQHEEGEEIISNTLAQYVAEDLEKNQSSGKSPELVAALGIFLFSERQMFEDAELELAQERHRYSIKISKINAQQRADLVHQLAQGLSIYYKGGIKPEEVANIALLASQVGALTFIGSQVD